MQAARTEPEQRQEPEASSSRARRIWSRIKSWHYSVPVIYLVIALPLEVFLSFFIPPMQSPDEGRHFLRSCQFAQGQVLPQVDLAAHKAGGVLPAAAVDFVHSKMTPEFYRKEDSLHTIGARLEALNQAAQHEPPLSKKEFGVFPGSAAYPPALYLPQTAGIRLVRFFADKAFVWFYAARASNAIAAVLVIFFALLLAPGYQFLLMIPAILPMSLYQIASISSDAGFISISIFLAALSIRFLRNDGRLLRSGIVVCLLLLTMGKPVYLPLALLLLPAYKRLGWRRAASFCAIAIAISAVAYFVWVACMRPVFASAGNLFLGGGDPSAQVQFIFTHPIGSVIFLLRSIHSDAQFITGTLIGFFGWAELPLPHWFYIVTLAFFAAIGLLFLLNWKEVLPFQFVWGAVAAIGIVAAVFLAAFVMWTPVGFGHLAFVWGRYLLPALPALAFCFPPLYRLARPSRMALAALALTFFCLSAFTTVRILKHYYFPETKLVGKNVRATFTATPGAACPATTRDSSSFWFSTVVNGTANASGKFRVVVADKNGTIWGESDPVLAGRGFPLDFLRGASYWRVHFWTPDRNVTLYNWLIRGNTACAFGSGLKFKPHQIPSA